MRSGARIGLVIPALNEEHAIGRVLDEVPAWVDHIIVADIGSTYATAEVARARGAQVVLAAKQGYGSACQAGIAALPECEVVVFMDGDHSDFPDQMHRLVEDGRSVRRKLCQTCIESVGCFVAEQSLVVVKNDLRKRDT